MHPWLPDCALQTASVKYATLAVSKSSEGRNMLHWPSPNHRKGEICYTGYIQVIGRAGGKGRAQSGTFPRDGRHVGTVVTSRGASACHGTRPTGGRAGGGAGGRNRGVVLE
jgi:hypothetical protein